jgi:hypothetical protein
MDTSLEEISPEDRDFLSMIFSPKELDAANFKIEKPSVR